MIGSQYDAERPAVAPAERNEKGVAGHPGGGPLVLIFFSWSPRYPYDHNTGGFIKGCIAADGDAWWADEEVSNAGIIMPGTILLGSRFYQEIAPNAKDRAEITRDDVTMKTPAGEFKDCVEMEETSGLDAGELCPKTYAPGIGLIQNEDLLLTHWRPARK